MKIVPSLGKELKLFRSSLSRTESAGSQLQNVFITEWLFLPLQPLERLVITLPEVPIEAG